MGNLNRRFLTYFKRAYKYNYTFIIDPVNCVAYENSGKYLASSSSDLTIKLWDLNNDYQCCKTFYGH
jgi:WD40 repeat protein